MKEKAKKKEKKLNKAVKAVIIITILVVVFVAAAYLIVYLSGYRIIRYKSPEGETKFFGKVDSQGLPYKGTVYFANGEKATINLAENTIEYSDGAVYVGETKDLLPHGKGKLTMGSEKNNNLETYEGDFFEGEITGYGTYIYGPLIGDKYEGFMTKGKPDGQGKYTWADGSVYEGGYKDGMKDGEGLYIWGAEDSVVSSYKGTFKNDVKDGYGEFVFSNGDKYEGEVKADVRDGQGTYTWKSGEYYVGEFKNNMMDGHGIYFWTSGRSYEGTFKEKKIVWELD